MNKANPQVVTAIHVDGNHTTDVQNPSSVALGTSLHDQATVTGITTSCTGFEPTGTVSFTFYGSNTLGNSKTGDCTDTNASGLGSATTLAGSPPMAESSSSTGALHAGGYAINATYSGSSDYNSKTSLCEPVTVNKGDVNVVTVIHEWTSTNFHSGPKTSFTVGEKIHDKATVSPVPGTVAWGIGAVPLGFEPSGLADFTLKRGPLDTNQCGTGATVASPGSVSGVSLTTIAGNGSAAESCDPGGCSTATNSYTTTGADAGALAYQAHYNGSGDYNTADSACEPMHVSLGTPGYWKNNAGATTAQLPEPLGGFSVTAYDTVGTVDDALGVFIAMNCKSNKAQDAVGCLAGHLLAAELNVSAFYSGNIVNVPDTANPSLSRCVSTEIVDANAFLSGITRTSGPSGAGFGYLGPSSTYSLTSAQRNTALGLKSQLDKFNNGVSCQ